LELNVTTLHNLTFDSWPWDEEGMAQRRAYCREREGRHDRLTFLYEVREGDYSWDLDYVHDYRQVRPSMLSLR
jgi:hypothetical protein